MLIPPKLNSNRSCFFGFIANLTLVFLSYFFWRFNPENEVRLIIGKTTTLLELLYSITTKRQSAHARLQIVPLRTTNRNMVLGKNK